MPAEMSLLAGTCEHATGKANRHDPCDETGFNAEINLFSEYAL